MPRPPLDWTHCRSFLAVMQQGSLSKAARILGLTQPTLGRHMAGLEDSLGAKLFTRSQTGLAPTAAAQELLPHARAMASASEALARAASGEPAGERGTVRLTASEFVGVEVLPPILARFRAKKPQIAIELAASNLQQDLLKREADIAVRMTRPRQTALIARHIGRVPIGLFAHRDYIARHGMPRDLEELRSHTLIGYDRDDRAWREISSGLKVTRDIFALRCDSDLAQLAALRAGFGIGGCQVPLARRDKALVCVLPDAFAPSIDMWLAMHEDLRGQRRVRLLFDHLAAALSQYVKSGRAAAGRRPSKSAKNAHIEGWTGT